MMKKIFLLFLALCLAASALGCRREVPDRLLTLSGGGETTAAAGESAPPQSSQGSQGTADSTDGDPTEGTAQKQAGTMAFSVTPETDQTLLSGRLEYTLTGVRIANNVSDLPDPAGFGSEAVPLYNETGAEQIYKYQSDRYPSFLLSDGGFVPELTVVLVDVTVESFDAVARTKKDADAQGRGGAVRSTGQRPDLPGGDAEHYGLAAGSQRKLPVRAVLPRSLAVLPGLLLLGVPVGRGDRDAVPGGGDAAPAPGVRHSDLLYYVWNMLYAQLRVRFEHLPLLSPLLLIQAAPDYFNPGWAVFSVMGIIALLGSVIGYWQVTRREFS